MSEQEKDLGALWVKKGAKGEYMTGSITIDGVETRIVCFLNTNKTETKHPDWKILRSIPQNKTEQNNPLPTEEDINPENIPF